MSEGSPRNGPYTGGGHFPPLLSFIDINPMTWLTVCSNAFGSSRISLASDNYLLGYLHYLAVLETDGIYSVADPGFPSASTTSRLTLRELCNNPRPRSDRLPLSRN
jgi:hypothetical protein